MNLLELRSYLITLFNGSSFIYLDVSSGLHLAEVWNISSSGQLDPGTIPGRSRVGPLAVLRSLRRGMLARIRGRTQVGLNSYLRKN
jgi:hypothetical protein